MCVYSAKIFDTNNYSHLAPPPISPPTPIGGGLARPHSSTNSCTLVIYIIQCIQNTVISTYDQYNTNYWVFDIGFYTMSLKPMCITQLLLIPIQIRRILNVQKLHVAGGYYFGHSSFRNFM